MVPPVLIVRCSLTFVTFYTLRPSDFCLLPRCHCHHSEPLNMSEEEQLLYYSSSTGHDLFLVSAASKGAFIREVRPMYRRPNEDEWETFQARVSSYELCEEGVVKPADVRIEDRHNQSELIVDYGVAFRPFFGDRKEATRSLTAVETIDFALRLATVLQSMHFDAGCIHSALHPGVVVSTSKSLKSAEAQLLPAIDFDTEGIALPPADPCNEDLRLAFAPPELVLRTTVGEMDDAVFTSDVYSFGLVVAWVMRGASSSDLPFSARDSSAGTRQQLKSMKEAVALPWSCPVPPPDWRESTFRELWSLLRGCTRGKPDDRLEFAEVLTKLEAFRAEALKGPTGPRTSAASVPSSVSDLISSPSIPASDGLAHFQDPFVHAAVITFRKQNAPEILNELKGKIERLEEGLAQVEAMKENISKKEIEIVSVAEKRNEAKKKLAVRYLEIAMTLPSPTATTTLSEFGRISQHQLFAKALELVPDEPYVWFSIADAMITADRLQFKGKNYHRGDVLVRVLELCPTFPQAWTLLAQELSIREIEYVSVGEEICSQITCYQKALEQDPEDALAWGSLAEDMRIQGVLSIVIDKQTYSDEEVALKAVECPGANHRTWQLLGLFLFNLSSVNKRIPRGPYQAVDAFVKQIELAPLKSKADGWNRLVSAMSQRRITTIVVDRRRYTYQQVVAMAQNPSAALGVPVDASCTLNVASDPSTGSAPSAAALVERAKVAKAHEKQGLLRRAVEEDAENATAWNMLGETVSASGKTTVNGVQYCPSDMFVAALTWKPTLGTAWSNLAAAMKTEGILDVTIQGEKYTVEKCRAKADSLSEPAVAHPQADESTVMQEQPRQLPKARHVDPGSAPRDVDPSLPAYHVAIPPSARPGQLMKPRTITEDSLDDEPAAVQRGYSSTGTTASVTVATKRGKPNTKFTTRPSATTLQKGDRELSARWLQCCQGIVNPQQMITGINGRTMTVVECFQAAMNADMTNPMAWMQMASAMSGEGGNFIALNTGDITKAEALEIVIELDPETPNALSNLASLLRKKPPATAVIYDREYTFKELCEWQVEVAPYECLHWTSLATATGMQETSIVNGKELRVPEILRQAIETEPSNPVAWNLFGFALMTIGSAYVDDDGSILLTAVDCYTRTLELVSPRFGSTTAEAWGALLKHVEHGLIRQPVVIAGLAYTTEDLRTKSVDPAAAVGKPTSLMATYEGKLAKNPKLASMPPRTTYSATPQHTVSPPPHTAPPRRKPSQTASAGARRTEPPLPLVTLPGKDRLGFDPITRAPKRKHSWGVRSAASSNVARITGSSSADVQDIGSLVGKLEANPEDATGWIQLEKLLKGKDETTVKIHGVEVTPMECHLRAINALMKR